jgi:phage baseplate assembly protein W
MAYQIISNLENEIVPQRILGISFSNENNVTFKPIYTSIEQASANLKNLLLTRIGERYHQPTFGTNLLNVIFEPNIAELKDDILDLILEPINYWLPYLEITSVEVLTAEDDPTLDYAVSISITFSINDIDTRTIKFNVTENGNLTTS